MRLHLLTLAALTLSQGAQGQATPADCRSGLPPDVARRLLQAQFANLVNPQSSTTLGSYAGVDIKDAKASVASATIFDLGSVLALKASAGTSNGFVPLFSGGTLNTEVSVGAQYSALTNGRMSLDYLSSSCDAYFAAKRKLAVDVDTKKTEIVRGHARTLLVLDTVRLTAKIEALKQALGSATEAKKDSLETELAKTGIQLTGKKEELRAFQPASLVELDNWRLDEEDKLETIPQLRGFSFGWLSMGLTLVHSSFRLFDPAEPVPSQVTKDRYLSPAVQVQYAMFKLSSAPRETFFWSVGATLALENNLAALKKLDLTDRVTYGPDPASRVSETRYQAWQGAYEEGLRTLTIASDYVRFLTNQNRHALHLYPEHVLKESLPNSTNVGVGLLFAFKGKDKPTSTVNVEAYVKLMDLANNAESDKSLLKRSGGGLRVAFPINFSPLR